MTTTYLLSIFQLRKRRLDSKLVDYDAVRRGLCVLTGQLPVQFHREIVPESQVAVYYQYHRLRRAIAYLGRREERYGVNHAT